MSQQRDKEYLDCKNRLREIWELLPSERTKADVRFLNTYGAVYGGCCERHADQMGCNCMILAKDE